jgi:hypothetical protein
MGGRSAEVEIESVWSLRYLLRAFNGSLRGTE